MSMNQRQSVGFTMLEMLVALSITIIMVLFIGEIFTTVKDAAASSIGTSRVLQHARIVNAQMDADTQPGMMVPPAEDGFLIVVNKEYAGVQISQDNPGTQTLFSDQLCFARLRGDLEPITPGNTNSVSSTSDAPYVKIWYGHALRTRPDGSDYTNKQLGPAGDGINQYAINWVFGRQALFLDEDTTTNPQVIYSQGAKYNSDVSGSGAPVPTKLYMGLTDVAGSTGAGAGNTALADISSQIVASKSAAIDFVYVNERLQANPFPVYDPDPDPDKNRELDAWQLAQTHPFFVPNTISIEIEFAGDYLPAGNPPTTPIGDGEIDTDSEDNIIWYSERSTHKGNVSNYTVSSLSAPATDNADELYVWRKGDHWPHLIRITYRLTDDRGVVSSDSGIGRTFEQIIVVNR